MFSSLYPARRLAAGLAVCSLVVGILGPAPLAVGQSLPDAVGVVDLETAEPLKLAHHGGEGVGDVGLGATSAAGQSLTLSGRASKYAISDSLFGNWLLNMAYERDPEIRRILKRSGWMDRLTMLSVAGVSGLSLAQSIYAYRHIDPQTIEITEAHDSDGHDHVHIPQESRVPATMGLIGSGVTLLGLGARTAMGSHLNHKLKKRQTEIKTHIEGILGRLEDGTPIAQIHPELTQWVGDRASREFLMLWRSTQLNDSL